MIKTKSILSPSSKEDGTRICVMRYIKPFYKYDEWLLDLAPSEYLLNSYRQYNITWEDYIPSYIEEMKKPNKERLIDSLRERSNNGEVITLLCWEKCDDQCHRRLLKELIEQEDNIIMKVRVTFYGEEGTIYSETDYYSQVEMNLGEWVEPFEKQEDSPAIGLIENLIQSDDCPPKFQFEHINKVKVEYDQE